MALYEYEQLGSSASAVIEAPDRAEAVRMLRERGVTPKRLDELNERRGGARSGGGATTSANSITSTPAAFRRTMSSSPRSGLGSMGGVGGRVKRAEMASLIRDMSVAMGAGLTLVQAMRVIQRQSRSERMRAMLGHLIEEVEQGRSFGDAAASWGKPFDELLVGLLRAGEQSGKLDEVMTQAATLLERDMKMRGNLVMGMVYPGVLAVLIAGAVGVVVTFVVPRLLRPLAGRISADQLPWPTRVVIGTTDFVTANWLWLAVAVVVAIVLARQALQQPATRLAVDRFLLRVPVIGRLARDVAVARFARTMGTLVGSGLPVLTALRGTRGTVGNRAMQAALDEISEAVQAGQTIAEPMDKTGMFPAMLTQIVGLGERSGRLATMLERAATVFEEKTEASVKVVTTLIPPVLVVMAAGVIAFVMAGVFLALLKMQEAIG